eukprot:scaffold700_cov560-Prasinococcus_capsulatus_cf.AAC.14
MHRVQSDIEHMFRVRPRWRPPDMPWVSHFAALLFQEADKRPPAIVTTLFLCATAAPLAAFLLLAVPLAGCNFDNFPTGMSGVFALVFHGRCGLAGCCGCICRVADCGLIDPETCLRMLTLGWFASIAWQGLRRYTPATGSACRSSTCFRT